MVKSPKWKDILFYPNGYEYVPRNHINGAGPRRFGCLVRDHILSVSISESANSHDGYYFLGRVTRRYADQVFLRNMRVQIDASDISNWNKKYCRTVAYAYYRAVRAFGGAFYKRC